jgi:hypothetical protein
MKGFSYANVAATVALVLALGGGAVYAADKIGSTDIAKNAVKSKHIKRNQVRGPDVKESSLGRVPSSADVGGMKVTTFTDSLPENGNGGDLVNIGGTRFEWSCAGGGVDHEVEKAASGPPLTVRQIIDNSDVQAYKLSGGNQQILGLAGTAVDIEFTVREASGKVTILHFRGFQAVNPGPADDCFAYGEIKTFGG